MDYNVTLKAECLFLNQLIIKSQSFKYSDEMIILFLLIIYIINVYYNVTDTIQYIQCYVI